jgi:ABC-type Mn2+/Zn2+ transport system ATPase subunit
MAKERKALTHKLSADNLTLIRGERCLFQGLSFALESGGLLILEGRNGCGKTSLIRQAPFTGMICRSRNSARCFMAVSSGWRIGPGSRVI